MAVSPSVQVDLVELQVSLPALQSPTDELGLSACPPDPSIFTFAFLGLLFALLCHLVASPCTLSGACQPRFFPVVTVLFGHMFTSLD